MDRKRIIKWGIGVVIPLAIGGAIYFGKTSSQPQEFGVIAWNKPTTDAGWAEDTKNEQIAYRSNEVLNQMKVAHEAKLARQEKTFEKFAEMERQGQDPVQYLYWEWYENLKTSYPDESEQWRQSEALKQAQEQYTREKWEIEKITQSLERMNKELELREKGFVVVAGEGMVLGSISQDRVRQIIDK